MANRLETPLGTEGNVLFSEELLVAQDDIRSIGKTVDTLLIEFDQHAFEEYLSFGSEALVGRKCEMTRIGSSTPSPTNAAKIGSIERSPKAVAALGSNCPHVVGGPSPP